MAPAAGGAAADGAVVAVLGDDAVVEGADDREERPEGLVVGVPSRVGLNDNVFGDRDAEGELRCGICYEARKNCVLLPCLHHLFCAECLNTHFSTSQARTCPVCRKGVSGVLVLQLE